MSKLRVAVVGTGLIANIKHLPAWTKLQGKGQVELVAICDINAENARKVADKFNVPNVHTDLAQLIAKEKPDIIDICTPPKTHCPLAVLAAEAGCHVMVEKPMAMNLEECDRIINAAKAKNVKIMCGHSDLFYRSFMKGKELLAKGAIGEFRGMRIFLSTPRDYITAKEDHWGNKLPGGVIGETGPHVVYMTLPFIPVIKEVGVFALKMLGEYPWSPYEDYRIELVGEKTACSIACTYTNSEWLCEVQLLGSYGMMTLDLETQAVTVYKRKDLKPTSAAFSQLRQARQLVTETFAVGARYLTGGVDSTHDIMCAEFVKAIQENKPSPVPGEEGRETIRVLNEIVGQLEQKYGKTIDSK
ncbi:MAG: Gfo/Idh/MocA family oxidoreductase [Phycisphaeraceae bacterium]|nr:Gfo/Idh/MocA family oxidoreductase [Phycisphaeraceae bacterium]